MNDQVDFGSTPLRDISSEVLKEIIAEHEKWVTTNQKEGKAAQLINANLKQADFRKVNLAGANFQGANLHKATLKESNFQGANFQGALLTDADLQRSSFEGADLSLANLEGAYIQTAIFNNADLQGANLSETMCQGTNFIGALNLVQEQLDLVAYGDRLTQVPEGLVVP